MNKSDGEPVCHKCLALIALKKGLAKSASIISLPETTLWWGRPGLWREEFIWWGEEGWKTTLAAKAQSSSNNFEMTGLFSPQLDVTNKSFYSCQEKMQNWDQAVGFRVVKNTTNRSRITSCLDSSPSQWRNLGNPSTVRLQACSQFKTLNRSRRKS